MISKNANSAPALWEQQGHVAIITLNRPDALNSVNQELSDSVGELLEKAESDTEIRAVVLTGSGRAFCAGADLKALAAGRDIYPSNHPEWGFAGYTQHWISKPTIAAVNGFALGGGTELVLASDLAVVDEDAKLGLPEVKRGLIAAAGGVIRLQQQIPKKLALQVALTGAPISPATAQHWGLINQVASRGTALSVALDLANRIADNAPLSIQYSKAMIHHTATLSDWSETAWELNAKSSEIVFSSDDAKEGPAAFTEKRDPMWQGT